MADQTQEEFEHQLNSTMNAIEDLEENQSGSFGNQAYSLNIGKLNISQVSPMKMVQDENEDQNGSFDNQTSLNQLNISTTSRIKVEGQSSLFNGSFSIRPDVSAPNPKPNVTFCDANGEQHNIPIDFLGDIYSNLLNQIKFSTLMGTKKEVELILEKWNGFAEEVDELINKFMIIRVINPGAEKKKVLKLALEKDLLAKAIISLKSVISKLDECSNILSKDKINQVYYEFFNGKICELEQKHAVYQIVSLVFQREYIKERMKGFENATKARDFIVRKVRTLNSSFNKVVRTVQYTDIAPIKLDENRHRHQLSFLNEEINKFDPLKSIR